MPVATKENKASANLKTAKPVESLSGTPTKGNLCIVAFLTPDTVVKIQARYVLVTVHKKKMLFWKLRVNCEPRLIVKKA